jgi:hypothetical protein
LRGKHDQGGQLFIFLAPTAQFVEYNFVKLGLYQNMEYNEKALTIRKKSKKFQRSIITYKVNMEISALQNND